MTSLTSPGTSFPGTGPAPGRKLLSGGLRRNRRRLVLASLLIMGHQTCEALVPVAIGWTVDLAVLSRSPGALVLCLAALTALFLTLTMCWRWAARYAYGAVQDEAHTLRSELAAHFLRHRPRGAARPRGELLSISTSDADLASQAVSYVSGLWGAAAALAVSCGVLLSIDLRLGLLLVAVAVAVTAGLNLVSPLLSRRSAAQQDSLAATSALAADLLGGLRALHGLGAQRQAAARYRGVSRRALADGIRSGNTRALQLAATSLGSTVVLAVAVGAAGLMALRGEISLGGFIAAVGAAQFIAEPLGHVGMFLQLRAAARAGADRIAGVYADPAQDDSSEQRDDDGGAGSGLAAPSGTGVLQLQPGELVGVVADAESAALLHARSGGGLPGTHREPHHADLFAGSVAENLALSGPRAAVAGAPGVSIAAAIRAAHVEDVVAALPQGLDTYVSDRGLSLSGGQRQRLALARALHTDPPVLFLFDPTSAVDSVTERSIAQGLREVRHEPGSQRITAVVTASPALLAATDRVVLLRGGRPVAVGTHEALLHGSADYRKAVLR